MTSDSEVAYERKLDRTEMSIIIQMDMWAWA